MTDRYLGRRLIAEARLHNYEHKIEAAVRRALARRRAAVEHNALTAAVVDPHHAIRAGGITYATVRCDDTCPAEHFRRPSVTAATHPDPFDESAWDTDLAEEVTPAIESMLADLNRGILAPFTLDPEQIGRVLGAIDVRSQVDNFVRLIRGIGPDTAGRINDALAVGVAKGEGIGELAARVADVFDMANRRASTIARTETNRAANAGANDAAAAINVELALTKTWLATGDDRTRDDHADADGQTVGFDEPFVVGGEECDYPCDPNLSPEQSVNCRCTVIFEAPEDVPADQQAEIDQAVADAEANAE